MQLIAMLQPSLCLLLLPFRAFFTESLKSTFIIVSSVHPQTISREPMNVYSCNLILGFFIKISKHVSSSAKI